MSKVNEIIERVERQLNDCHRDYVDGLRKAMEAIEHELKAHEGLKRWGPPSTTFGGDLWCDQIRDAKHASDRITVLAGQLDLLEHLARTEAAEKSPSELESQWQPLDDAHLADADADADDVEGLFCQMKLGEKEDACVIEMLNSRHVTKYDGSFDTWEVLIMWNDPNKRDERLLSTTIKTDAINVYLVAVAEKRELGYIVTSQSWR